MTECFPEKIDVIDWAEDIAKRTGESVSTVLFRALLMYENTILSDEDIIEEA